MLCDCGIKCDVGADRAREIMAEFFFFAESARKWLPEMWICVSLWGIRWMTARGCVDLIRADINLWIPVKNITMHKWPLLRLRFLPCCYFKGSSAKSKNGWGFSLNPSCYLVWYLGFSCRSALKADGIQGSSDHSAAKSWSSSHWRAQCCVREGVDGICVQLLFICSQGRNFGENHYNCTFYTCFYVQGVLNQSSYSTAFSR